MDDHTAAHNATARELNYALERVSDDVLNLPQEVITALGYEVPSEEMFDDYRRTFERHGTTTLDWTRESCRVRRVTVSLGDKVNEKLRRHLGIPQDEEDLSKIERTLEKYSDDEHDKFLELAWEEVEKEIMEEFVRKRRLERDAWDRQKQGILYAATGSLVILYKLWPGKAWARE